MLNAALFVADIHLSPKSPATAAQFFGFLSQAAQLADSLYILGDLFDAWIGDDDLVDPFNREVAARLADCKIPVRLLHGNRDFLLGEVFLRAARAELLPDPALLEICGKPTLLAHGDLFCTNDSEYLAFRKTVRDRSWQSDFLSRPLLDRKQFAARLRAESEDSKNRKSSQLMDVDAAEVTKYLREYGYPRIIHGHTHRPGHYSYEADGRKCERWVLGDWHDDGASIVYCDRERTEIRRFSNR